MKKLFNWYKNLPPELRTVLALAGLGTPVAMIYYISKFTPLTPTQVFLGIVVLVAVLVGISALFSRLAGRGARTRTNKMARELAADPRGPVSMDAGAAIKENNRKFNEAVRNMEKTLKVSVFDLPWYIVIGDSGCGKTKLVNESGLTFSTGKPEGYQLGTLNYNWWFTEEAIFIDMAGRLCNPRDDADHREWTAFLDTIARGRAGFPINGVLVCISAEHLLQDPPEKIEQDANTALERLRDLQSKLGVTFAAHLIVTKCDKIPGFMELFDRSGADITLKNQMFGWSRPGEFDELFDPEQFGLELDRVYARLNELRLQRLSDEDAEERLGLAYGFAEEFRQLRGPLQTYVRTLFPALRNPRAIKNLIFRGVYFTSATQEGELIRKHIIERLGGGAADLFEPLDTLFPRKRSLFIKDLLLRKALPEYGLVFRNEDQVKRNRRLGRSIVYGGVAAGLVLFGALGLAAKTFSKVVDEPRKEARLALNVASPEVALVASGRLQQHGKILRDSMAAEVLSMGYGADEPADNLDLISRCLFEGCVLMPVLREAGEALRDKDWAKDGKTATDVRLTALKDYVAWTAVSGKPERGAAVGPESFNRLLAAARLRKSTAASLPETDLTSRVNEYFQKSTANPARFLDGLDAPHTIETALGNLREYYRGYAELNKGNRNEVVAEWMRIADACKRAQDTYEVMIERGKKNETIAATQDYDKFLVAHSADYDKYHQAYEDCAWQLKKKGEKELAAIRDLRELLLSLQKDWKDYQAELKTAWAPASAKPERKDAAEIAGWIKDLCERTTEPVGLDALFDKSIKDLKLSELCESADCLKDDKRFKEIYKKYEHLLEKTEKDGVTKLGRTSDFEKVTMCLAAISAAPDGRAAGGDGPASWNVRLKDLLGTADKAGGACGQNLKPLTATYWNEHSLDPLIAMFGQVGNKVRLKDLLTTIQNEVQARPAWGLAAFVPDWAECYGSEYSITGCREDGGADAPKSSGEAPAKEPTERSRRRRNEPDAADRDDGQDRKIPDDKNARAVIGDGLGIPYAATPTFLDKLAEQYVLLQVNLARAEGHYLKDAGGANLHRDCATAVQLAWRDYAEKYATEWSAAYGHTARAFESEIRDKLLRGADDWSTFQRRLKGMGDKLGGTAALSKRLEEIFRATRWATWHYEVKDGKEVSWAWSEEADDNKYWREAAEAVGKALEDGFSSRLLGSKPDAKTPGAPWGVLGRELDGAWRNLLTEIAACDDLPSVQALDVPTGQVRPVGAAVPWGRLAEVKSNRALGEELFVHAALGFERDAQALLDVEITRLVCQVHDDACSGLGCVLPIGGAAATVPFERFAKFLGQIANLKFAVESVEKSLPESAPKGARSAYYSRCAKWAGFLKQTCQARVTRDDSPEGAQNHFKRVELDIGLIPDGGGETVKLSTQAGESKSMTAKWDWTASGAPGKPMRVSLVDGIPRQGQNVTPPENENIPLGDRATLGLCIYLQKYGRPMTDKPGVWQTEHSFGDPDFPGNPNKQLRERLTFALTPNMPEPISRPAGR